MSSHFSFSTIDELLGKDAVKNTLKNVSHLLSEIQPFQQELLADVLENDTIYMILVDIPGCLKTDITAEVVNDNKLVINIKKNLASSYGNYQVVRKERLDGQYRKDFVLPETVDTATISAKYDSGVLAVTFKKNHTQTRSVPIY